MQPRNRKEKKGRETSNKLNKNCNIEVLELRTTDLLINGSTQ